MELTVVEVPERAQYVIRDGYGDAVGRVDYELEGEWITLAHTEVSPGHRNQGVADQLVRGVMDDARTRGLSVAPRCPYVQGWIQHHPEYADLVDESAPGGTAL
ncbi:hypothetical protein FHX37_3298 [Haloactinospora alba]|uniref:N-acetyltransferase domain-containing protein n=1 Tax=Haloactinospora alba TaxID=405555 RepID=A0A543NN88_9ACTN|nr:GNAT family N-acetyltransferase [Haloactinospora alba]TQN33292.1 hypothetical protein FHX37_3298 [Haloactinospora alba]